MMAWKSAMLTLIFNIVLVAKVRNPTHPGQRYKWKGTRVEMTWFVGNENYF